MALYDLAGALNCIKEETNKKAIYIGHSGGTTLAYIYASLEPEVAEITLKGIVSLAPLAYVDGMKSYLKFVLLINEYLKVKISINNVKYHDNNIHMLQKVKTTIHTQIYLHNLAVKSQESFKFL